MRTLERFLCVAILVAIACSIPAFAQDQGKATVIRPVSTVSGLNCSATRGDTVFNTTDHSIYTCGPSNNQWLKGLFGNTIIAIPFEVGDPRGGGSVLTTGVIDYVTIPKACTLAQWDIAVDTGTATVTTWKVATGTAIPTVSNSISTSGVSISTGTAIRSSTLSDFTTTSFSAGDIVAANLSAVSSAHYVQFELELTCSQ